MRLERATHREVRGTQTAFSLFISLTISKHDARGDTVLDA